MHNLYHFQSKNWKTEKRIIFQMAERAPKASDTMKGPESKSEAAQLGEVASQSPSQIFNDTISAGSTIKTQFVGSVTILANLVNTNPLSPTGTNGGATTTTGSSDPAAATGQNPVSSGKSATTTSDPNNITPKK